MNAVNPESAAKVSKVVDQIVQLNMLETVELVNKLKVRRVSREADILSSSHHPQPIPIQIQIQIA